MRKFNYDVFVNKLNPPLGGMLKYYAKVPHIYEDLCTKETEVYVEFGETWGETKDEAEQKMREIVNKWIKQQL